jgi:hypothetical protein
MTFGQNPFNPSRSLPTLAAIQRRRRELLSIHARQQQAQATAEPGEFLAQDQAYLPEEALHIDHQEEVQEEHQELQHSYPGDDSEPSLPLPPPALAHPALYGIAGRIVRSPPPSASARLSTLPREAYPGSKSGPSLIAM